MPTRTSRRTRAVGTAAVLLALGPAVTEGRAGERRTAPSRRFIEVETGVDLAVYRGGVALLGATEVTANTDKAKTIEAVRSSSAEILVERLVASELFSAVRPEVAAEPPPDGPALRFETHVHFNVGSRFYSTGSRHTALLRDEMEHVASRRRPARP